MASVLPFGRSSAARLALLVSAIPVACGEASTSVGAVGSGGVTRPGKLQLLFCIECWERATPQERLEAARYWSQRRPDLEWREETVECGGRRWSTLVTNDPRSGLEFAFIPGRGCSVSTSGCLSQRLPHQRGRFIGFAMARTEVTREQWARMGGEIEDDVGEAEDPKLPATAVWIESIDRTLAAMGLGLPSMSEWDHALCGRTPGWRWYWGNDPGVWTQYAWLNDDRVMRSNVFGDDRGPVTHHSGGRPHPVAMLKPNSFGLFDLIGNVWETLEEERGSRYDGSRVRMMVGESFYSSFDRNGTIEAEGVLEGSDESIGFRPVMRFPGFSPSPLMPETTEEKSSRPR